MNDPEGVETMEQLLADIAADWKLLQTLRTRLPLRVAQARGLGIPGRLIARLTRVPERNVRRWAKAHPETQSGPERWANTAGALIPTCPTRRNP